MRPAGTGRPPTAVRRPSSTGLASSTARFEVRASRVRRAWWHRLVWFVLALTLLGGGTWLVGWSPVLAVRSVDVSGATGAEASAVRALVEVPLGTPLARVDTAAVGRRIRSRITVAEVSVQRSWPSTLDVHVVLRTPAIIIRSPQGQLEVVDRQGVAYTSVSRAPQGVPVVSAVSSAALAPDAVKAAIAVVDTLPADLAARVSAMTVSSADLVTFKLGSVTVVWGGAEDGARKVAIIQALLRTKPSLIDVSAPDTPVTK